MEMGPNHPVSGNSLLLSLCVGQCGEWSQAEHGSHLAKPQILFCKMELILKPISRVVVRRNEVRCEQLLAQFLAGNNTSWRPDCYYSCPMCLPISLLIPVRKLSSPKHTLIQIYPTPP